MSLYNMVFGENEQTDAILATLGLTRESFGRFRDVFVAEGKICVYARCGGGNRADYPEVFKLAYRHPDFDSERDDDFDCTYCTFRFNFPKAFEAELRAIDSGEPFDPSGRWLRAIEALRTTTPKGDP